MATRSGQGCSLASLSILGSNQKTFKRLESSCSPPGNANNVRITSKQNVHEADVQVWPASVPLFTSQIGDSVATSRFGLRKVSQRYFTYDSLGHDRPLGEVTHLTVDVSCQ